MAAFVLAAGRELDFVPVHAAEEDVAEAQGWPLDGVVRDDGSAENPEPTGGEVDPPGVAPEYLDVERVGEECLPDIQRVGEPANPRDGGLIEDAALHAARISYQP